MARCSWSAAIFSSTRWVNPADRVPVPPGSLGVTVLSITPVESTPVRWAPALGPVRRTGNYGPVCFWRRFSRTMPAPPANCRPRNSDDPIGARAPSTGPTGHGCQSPASFLRVSASTVSWELARHLDRRSPISSTNLAGAPPTPGLTPRPPPLKSRLPGPDVSGANFIAFSGR